jgi:alpha-1,3/alpha-1,6-mannosyltransferase
LAESLKLSNATVRTAPTALAVPADIAVLFLLSVPSAFKETLLSAADLLIYTPRNEHFGIVPLEAMLCGTPVLAANEGGPLETVVDGVTGWLRDARDVATWTKVMAYVLDWLSPEELAAKGRAGKHRVQERFSKEQMARSLNEQLIGLTKAKKRRSVVSGLDVMLILGAILVTAISVGLGIRAAILRA